ncbi:MAG: Na+ dependent nucleoside transporter [Bacteroidetes bacterium]|nr:Na+ dependent nucleoside transporter [Bacteroidota bacterium]
MQENVVFLNCVPGDTLTLVDSTIFRVFSGRPELIYYTDGQQVSRILDDGLAIDSLVYRYTIDKCTPDSLVITGNGYVYTLTGTKNTVAQLTGTGFSMKSMARGTLGMLVLLMIAYVFSANRKAISWRIVILGILTQVIIAIAVLKLPFMQNVFEFLGMVFIKILDFSKIGGKFLFQSFSSGQVEIGLLNFAFQILPTIIFFSAITSLLFYFGIIQKVVWVMAWLLTRMLKISGAESLSATMNIFLGQTEAPLLIKEYLPGMTRSEILCVMVGGMATIAGGVMAIYIGLLGGSDPSQQLLFAKHLITASVMAAPGAIVAAKMLFPQTEPVVGEVKISKEKIGDNFLDAIANGTGQGLRLAVNVAAMLLVFIAFIAMLNFILQKVGDWTTLNDQITLLTKGQYHHLSMQFLLGYALSPLAWTMGVCKEDMTLVAQLLGEKTILNEMIAYISLKDYISADAFVQQKSYVMATYMLCGFANFSSIGIQLGGIGALAPNQRTTLSKLAFRALLGGTLASLFSATIVGIILG